ncbi:MAG: colicin E3/pyocin S6 family cytotoxin [Candidatus Fimenecus sp.]
MIDEIEVFDRMGMHLGVMDPVTGEMIKNAVKGRR